VTSPLGGARSIQLSYRGMRASAHPSRPAAATKDRFQICDRAPPATLADGAILA
jgi:hypothetical protein